jgi:hypothetical protein
MGGTTSGVTVSHMLSQLDTFADPPGLRPKHASVVFGR